jgi:hypothetical protein
MLTLLLPLLLQISAPEAAQATETPTATVELPAPVKPDASPEPPKVVCTMEPVTGTRARKKKVCRTAAYEKGSQRTTEYFRQLMQGSGNITPPLPKGIGG